ncbi:MAG TPA: hypothetical protein VIG99_28005 [Myxococcaceae bacterium]|jgi:hypothetical protein
MHSGLRFLLVCAVVVGLACKGEKGDPGAQGDQGPPGDPGVATATAPLALSGASNATISIARASSSADGYLAASDYRSLRATGGGNLLDWRSDLARWANTCGVNPAVTISTTDSQEGDTSFEFNVSAQNAAGSCEEYGEFIEIDPTASYSGQVWAKLVTGAGGFYAGFATYDAAKAPIDNRYFIANNATLTTGTWTQFVGAIGGVGAGNNAFPANARFVRPIVNPNFNNTGNTRVDGLKVFEGARRLPTLYRQGVSATQVLPNTDNSCGVTAGSPWTALNGMTINVSVNVPTEIELNFQGAMGDVNARTEGLHCALRYLIDGQVVANSSPTWGHYTWSTNTYQWHGISARRRALVGAGGHVVTVQGRSGLCSTPGGSDTGYCVAEVDQGLGLFLEVVVP